jgi:hypothetical protein
MRHCVQCEYCIAERTLVPQQRWRCDAVIGFKKRVQSEPRLEFPSLDASRIPLIPSSPLPLFPPITEDAVTTQNSRSERATIRP